MKRVNRFLVGMTAVVVGLGLFASASVIYAGETKPVETVADQSQGQVVATVPTPQAAPSITIRCDGSMFADCAVLAEALTSRASDPETGEGKALIVLGMQDEWETFQQEAFDVIVLLAPSEDGFVWRAVLGSNEAIVTYGLAPLPYVNIPDADTRSWDDLGKTAHCISGAVREFVRAQTAITYEVSCTIGVSPGCTITVGGATTGEAADDFLGALAVCVL